MYSFVVLLLMVFFIFKCILFIKVEIIEANDFILDFIFQNINNIFFVQLFNISWDCKF